jgi:hypothetical protein
MKVDPPILACDGKTYDKPCTFTQSGIELDECKSIAFGASRYFCSDFKNIEADEICLQGFFYCEVSKIKLGKSG